MQITFFSFIMSLLWFNLYILIINAFRQNDNFIISFSGLPLIFFLSLSIFRLIFNFEIPGSMIIESENIFAKIYNFIRMPLNLISIKINIYYLFIFIFILGIIILLTNTIRNYIVFKNILGKLSKQQTNETEQILNKILIQKRMSGKIEIIQNEDISSPFILGILKGKIYIPKLDFSEEEFEYIISHEINHFLGKDSLKKILIQIIKHLFWWNPLTHLFANNFNHILEIQCDLKTTVNFSEEEKLRYLESITKIIRNGINTNIKNVNYIITSNLVEIDEFNSLKQRFRMVLNYRPQKNMFKVVNTILYVLASFLFISSYFIIIQPDYEPANNEMYEKQEENNSFIIENLEGSYDIYINNTFKYSIKKLKDLNKNLKELPIYKEGVN